MKIKLYLPFVLLLLFLDKTLFAQNIYNFTNASNGAPNFVFANLSATNLSPVNGNGTNTPCTNGGGVSGLTLGSAISAYNPSSFALNVDLTPATGYLVNVTGITVNLRRSGTGPANARFAYSINGGVNWVDKGSDDFPNNGSCGQFSSHSWTLPATATATAPGMFKFRIYFFNASNPGSGTLQVANLYINGSVAQACITPTATISGGGSICNGTSTNITFTGTPNATVTYTRNGGPNQFITLSASGTAVLNTGTLTSNTVYSLVGAVNGACTAVLTGNAAVIMKALPTVVVTPSNDSVCLGQGKVITATGAATYTWSPSATLSSATGASVTATPTGLTTYTVTGTAANACVNTATTTINTLALPPASITPATSPIFCPGGSVLMDANTGTGFTYQWKLNGTNIPGATAGSYNATAAGDYTVVVTNSNGCSTTSAIQNVISNTPPPATITPAGTVSICTGTSTTLSVNTGVGLTYQWRLNGSDIPGATNTTFNTGIPGNYTVRVIAGPNCSNLSAITDLALLPLPPAVVNPGGLINICPGNSVTLNANTGSTLGYQWLKDNVIIAGATNAAYAANTAGNYRAVVINTSTTCKDTSIGVAVAIAPLPAASISYNGTTSFCEASQTLTMTANSGTALTYQWQSATANIPGATNIAYTTGLPGSYRVVVTNSYGCNVASAPVVITTFPNPQGGVTYSSPLVFCQGGAVALNATTGAGFNYRWYKNGVEIPNTNSFAHIVDSAGQYAVLITNSFNCTVFSNPVGVTVNAKPDPIISRNGMELSTSNYISYQWYRDNQPIGSATGQTHMATQNGGYVVKVVDANGCENMSKLVFVNNVGVKDKNGAGDMIKLYPNPVRDILHIDSPVPVKCVVQDPTGKMVVYPSVTKALDLSSFANGVYIISIYDKEGQLLKTSKVSVLH